MEHIYGNTASFPPRSLPKELRGEYFRPNQMHLMCKSLTGWKTSQHEVEDQKGRQEEAARGDFPLLRLCFTGTRCSGEGLHQMPLGVSGCQSGHFPQVFPHNSAFQIRDPGWLSVAVPPCSPSPRQLQSCNRTPDLVSSGP